MATRGPPTTKFLGTPVNFRQINNVVYSGHLSCCQLTTQTLTDWNAASSCQKMSVQEVLECERFGDIHLIGMYVLVSFNHMQVCKYASMQVCRYTSMHICKYESMRVYK